MRMGTPRMDAGQNYTHEYGWGEHGHFYRRETRAGAPDRWCRADEASETTLAALCFDPGAALEFPVGVDITWHPCDAPRAHCWDEVKS